MNAFAIDGFEFCRRGERRQGEIAVSDLNRLAAELTNGTNSAGMLRWSLQGGVHQSGHPQLMLSVAAPVQLRCQRCLGPVAFEIDSESVLVLAKDDASADEIEAQLDDDAIDVIVSSKTLDARVLIEDEALLALPLSPKHETCPDQAALKALNEVKKESPFSVLRNLELKK
jgi:uncharacterized protein